MTRQTDPTLQGYVGDRILQAMKGAPTYSNAIFEMVRRYAGTARPILDFGAGEGTFAAKFRELGIAVDSVEPDSELRIRLLGIAERIYSDIGEIPDCKYEFAYSINVLEHIDDLNHACSELVRVLRPGARLFVFVPAFAVLWTSLDDEIGHCRRFTRKTLTQALTKVGFAVRQIEYFDSLGFPAALAVRALEKLGLFSYNQRTISLYDRLIFPFSRSADAAFSNILGKNIIAVVEKSAQPAGAPRPR